MFNSLIPVSKHTVCFETGVQERSTGIGGVVECFRERLKPMLPDMGPNKYWFTGLLVYRLAWLQPILPNMEPKSIGFMG